MMKSLMIALSLSISTSVFAISEINYAEEYNKQIIPVIKNYQHGTFFGVDNISIHYASYTTNTSSTRCMIVLPGRSEPIEKYAEVLHSLDTGVLAGEFTYFLMDHRGQGSSGRMLSKEAGDSEKGHVDHFENYGLDLKKFLDTVVAKKKCSEKYLLAHSLGAGISVDFMQKYPEYFDRAALSSPMLKIQTKPYAYAVARSVVAASMAIGRGNKYGAGQKPFNPTRNFETNTFTTSPARYEMAMGMYDMIPEARLGGVTNRWLNEVFSATSKIRKHYSDLHIPLRVFNAGNETYSWSSEMVRLCEEAPYCNRIFLETSKHEVLMDRDENRDMVIYELEKFFK